MIFHSPENFNRITNLEHIDDPWLFLAGTIEQGKSVNWQQTVIDNLDHCYNIMNPRRKEWDENWVQDFNNPAFFQQVTWELDALHKANVVLMNILPDSKSPISLLELGLYAASGKLIVSCPEGFWRKGNVDIVCYRYSIPVVDSLNEAIEFLENHAERIEEQRKIKK